MSVIEIKIEISGQVLIVTIQYKNKKLFKNIKKKTENKKANIFASS